jgi:hypothetical protein
VTQITTEATIASNRPTSDQFASPADILLQVIVTFLAPLFLVESDGDIQCARMAALETVNAYRASDPVDLIAVAQVIACGLTGLGSLCLSMADDISLSMLLRLRSNAVALNRAAERNRRTLCESRTTEVAMPRQTDAMRTAAEPDDAFREPGVAASLPASRERAVGARPQPQAEAPAPIPTPARPHAEAPAATVARAPSVPATERPWQAAWGSVAATVAAEYTASLPHLPPAERRMATVRAAALSSAANDLLAGVTPPRLRPGDLTAPIRPNPA